MSSRPNQLKGGCVAHSPHIKSITERISIDGEQISQAEFAGLAAQDASVMQQALQGAFGPLTHFEVLTALAFKHFQRKQVRICFVQLSSTTFLLVHLPSAVFNRPTISYVVRP